MQPWRLLADPSGYIFNWLLGYSGGLGSIAGVLIADYWFVRRRQLRARGPVPRRRRLQGLEPAGRRRDARRLRPGVGRLVAARPQAALRLRLVRGLRRRLPGLRWPDAAQPEHERRAPADARGLGRCSEVTTMSTVHLVHHSHRRGDRRALPPPHDLRVVAAVEGRPDPGRARRGRLLLDARGQALPRLQQPADVLEHRPLAPEGGQGDPGAGGGARLREPVPGHRAARAARREAGRARARRHRRLLLHERRRRGQRERDPRSRASRPAATRSWRATARTTAGPPARSRSPATRGAGRRSRACPASSARPSSTSGARKEPEPVDVCLRELEDVIRYEGASEHRGVPDGDRGRHERPADPARRLPAGRARDLRPPRHPADRRRGDVRLRPHRRAGSRSTTGRWCPTSSRWPRASPPPTCRSAPSACGRSSSRRFQERAFPGGLTYNSHPLACATALATIAVYEDEKLIENARAHGQGPAPAHARAREEAPLGRAPRARSASSACSSWCGTARASSRWRPTAAPRTRWRRSAASSARTASTPSCAGTPSSPTRRSRSPRPSSRRACDDRQGPRDHRPRAGQGQGVQRRAPRPSVGHEVEHGARSRRRPWRLAVARSATGSAARAGTGRSSAGAP